MNTVVHAFRATADSAPEHAFLSAPPAPGRAWDPDGVFGRGILDIGALLAAPLPPRAALTEDKPV